MYRSTESPHTYICKDNCVIQIMPTLVHGHPPSACPTECPIGSTEPALEITVSWEDSSSGVSLHVIEPGGVQVSDGYETEELGVSTSTFAFGCNWDPYTDLRGQTYEDMFLPILGLKGGKCDWTGPNSFFVDDCLRVI